MVREQLSPNHDERPEPVDILVMHYTGMTSGRAAIDRLCDPASRVSCHYVVEEDGTVWRLVPEARRAWHAGVSAWRGHELLNGRSIGIEIVNPGHEWGYRPFPEVQMAAVRDLSLGILSRHAIPPRNVVAHSDIAPDRKEDPGELFDWPGLAVAGVGLWPDFSDTLAGVTDARADLARIGYPVSPESAGPEAFATVLRAFQRHWRPAAITGLADAETAGRIAILAAAIA
ncbi:N-acetylmuramoyl-L-alanine amidase [Acidisoma cladoniae]|jgi:N-acetylmuramoyl-L-alanine amidase|uniref:N-acetylmuramoyl-L-alanine amidase n=1 Tax=Acidisoma cladoniae TaxID=3040935 RepID=UPI00254D25EF|nr:N-acetylmuramoyl-L-alanine amidase [Acidisoma sp. PAMC 29798]